MFGRMNFFFNIHFKKNIVLYSIVIFIFLIGITSGAFTVNAISLNQKGGLAEYMNMLLDTTAKGSRSYIDKMAILLEGLRQYFGFAFVIWFFGLFYLGIPIIIVAFGVRGFLLGFTTGFFVSNYGAKGFLFILLYILPQNLIYIPCMMGLTIISLGNATNNFKRRKDPLSRQFGNQTFATYTFKSIIITAILIIPVLFEAFITPFLLEVFSNIVNIG